MLFRALGTVLSVAAIAAFGICNAEAANISSFQSGNWSTGTTWVGGVPPVAGDVVTIASTHTVTVDVNSAAASVTIAANAAGTSGLVISSGVTLTLTGALTMTSPTAGTSTVNVGAGNLVAGSVAIAGAGGGRVCLVTVSTGTITTSGSITFSGNAAGARFTSTGASTVNVGGNFGSGGTLTTSGTGTIDFNGSAAQTMGPYTTYNNLVISNTGSTVSLTGTTTLSGTLTVASGTLAIGGVNLTVNGATSVSGIMDITGAPRTKAFNDLTINDGGVFQFAVAENITENGNLEVDGTGTITGTQGLWRFQSPGGGTLSGTAASTTLTTATFTTPYTVSGGAWIVSGVLTVTGTTLTNNATSLTAGTSLAGSGSLIQGANATLHLGGTSAITTLTATANGNTVDYSGAAQTVRSMPYWNLSLSGTGAKTMPAATMNLAGDFTMTGTCSATARGAMNVAGGFSIGGSGTFTAGAFTHTVGGDVTNNATLTATGSTFSLIGTADQNLIGPTVTTFNNLIINKASGDAILQQNENVGGTLTLTNGLIVTGANSVTMNAGSAVAQTNGWVDGNLIKNVATGANVARTFEVGDASSYTPVNVTFAAVSAAGSLTVNTTPGDHPSLASSDINPPKSVNRYWTLAASGGLTFTTYSSTFNFVAGDVDAGANTATFVARDFSGGAWSNTTAGARTATSTQITGQSVMGDFAIGNVLSVSVSNNVFAFGTQPIDTWLAPQSSVITNDGTEAEDMVASISTFTSGPNTWSLSSSTNGPDQVRAQWSTVSSSGPWSDIAAYATNFTVATNLAAGGTVTLYFRIQSPTAASTTNQYASTFTVTAQ